MAFEKFHSSNAKNQAQKKQMHSPRKRLHLQCKEIKKSVICKRNVIVS